MSVNLVLMLPIWKKNLSKKQLEAMVDELRKEISGLTIARAQLEDELNAARTTIHGQADALTLAEARAVTAENNAVVAEAQAAAAQAAQTELQGQLNEALAAGQPGLGVHGGHTVAELPEIPRPTGSGWSIREAMNIDRAGYAEIQRTIRSLVIRSQLDWTEDFRRQDADKLATMFRAARKAHPVLRRYSNNWATAAIARQYMQNKRKHAYKHGYIKKRPNAMDGPGGAGCRPRREDEDDEPMGGAGASMLSV